MTREVPALNCSCNARRICLTCALGWSSCRRLSMRQLYPEELACPFVVMARIADVSVWCMCGPVPREVASAWRGGTIYVLTRPRHATDWENHGNRSRRATRPIVRTSESAKASESTSQITNDVERVRSNILKCIQIDHLCPCRYAQDSI